MLGASGALRGLGEGMGWRLAASGGDIWCQVNGEPRDKIGEGAASRKNPGLAQVDIPGSVFGTIIEKVSCSFPIKNLNLSRHINHILHPRTHFEGPHISKLPFGILFGNVINDIKDGNALAIGMKFNFTKLLGGVRDVGKSAVTQNKRILGLVEREINCRNFDLTRPVFGFGRSCNYLGSFETNERFETITLAP